jgi:hypothetical protein
VQIITCQQHDIQNVFPDDHIPSFDETFSALLEAAESPLGPIAIQSELTHWCSFCFTPALFSCCTPSISLFSPDDGEQEMDGCGLKLCQECKVKLTEVFAGDSSVMAATLDFEPKAKAETEDMEDAVVRADVGFLCKDGLLMRTLEADAGAGADEGMIKGQRVT